MSFTRPICLALIATAMYGCSQKGESAQAAYARKYEEVSAKSRTELLVTLRYGGDTDRMLAASVLVQKGDKTCVLPLVAALRDRNWDVRSYAVNALGEIGDNRATAPLIAGIKEAILIAYANNRISNEWGKILSFVESVSYALVKINDPRAVNGLVEILDNDGLGDMRAKTADILGRLGDRKAVKPLIKALRSKNLWPAQSAAAALGMIKDPVAVEPLIQALNSNIDGLSASAANALGEIGDRRALLPLAAALKAHDDYLRVAAASALGGIKDPASVKYLIQALRDKNYMVRVRAVQAMGKLKDPAAVETLIRIIHRNGFHLKEEAVIALGEIGDKRAIEPLKRLLHKRYVFKKQFPTEERLVEMLNGHVLDALRKNRASS
jgi:HEAT repeat protein